MKPPFDPPTRASLAAVDVAEGVEYGDQCEIVEGVVAEGQGGWCGAEDRYDVPSLSLKAWRRPGGEIRVQSLDILRPVPCFMQSESDDRSQSDVRNFIFEELPPYSIQRMSVLISKDETRAVCERVLELSELDPALLAVSKRLQEPVVIATQLFGMLTLNKLVNIFEGQARWNGQSINVSVEKGLDDGIEDSLKTAQALWSDQETWSRKVEEFAIAELLPLKNEAWLDEGEKSITAKEFKRRMSLRTITVSGKGRFDFWHDDGDLFLGHSIQISGNLKDGLTAADIPG